MGRLLKTPHLLLVLLLTLLWFGGATWWYVCETQELCEEKEQKVAYEQPEKLRVIEQIEKQEVEPEVVTEDFDTSFIVSVYFSPNSDEFTNEEWSADLQVIVDHLEQNKNASALVEGFAAQVVSSVNADGDNLSLDRAEAVKAYMVERGVLADQISTDVRAFDGADGDNTTAAGRAQNRRAEVKVN